MIRTRAFDKIVARAECGRLVGRRPVLNKEHRAFATLFRYRVAPGEWLSVAVADDNGERLYVRRTTKSCLDDVTYWPESR